MKEKLVELTNNIHIIHEITINNIDLIKDLIRSAKRIFFLGFGFADENLEALGLPNNLNHQQEIYGTAMGLSNRRVEQLKRIFASSREISSTFHKSFKNRIRLEKVDCLSLLQEYL